MKDIRHRWKEILEETSTELSLDEFIDVNVMSLNELGRATARNQMGRTGTGGDPLTSRGANAYDDISDDEKTLGEDDPIKEALSASGMRRGRLNEEDNMRRQKMSSIQTIRTTLESVWQMLGKAETKLGVAEFSAEDMDFSSMEKTLEILTANIKEIMARIESTRDKAQLNR